MEVTLGAIAVIIAYLTGSIPGAYIITRLFTGKDIRKLGGGNAGARNVLQEVGLKAAIPVAIIDVGKGALAVVLAHRLLGSPPMQILGAAQVFILISGVAAVAGHIWSIYLKFDGGNGLSATIGVLAILMPKELLVALALTVVLGVLTRNPVLSVNISLLTVPVFAWFSGDPRQYVILPIVLAVMLILHFVPDARAALAKAGSKKNLAMELARVGKTTKKQAKGKKSKPSTG